MMVPRPVSVLAHTFVLALSLFLCGHPAAAQKRATRFSAKPSNTVEAAALEFALSADELNELIGKKANVLTSNGKEESNVEITRFYTGRDESQIKSMEVKAENATRGKRLFAPRLVEMKVDDKTYQFQYLPSLKSAAVEDLTRKNAAISEKLRSSNEEFWEEIPEDEQLKYVDEYKEFLKKVGQHFAGFNMQLYETKYFLFYTDMPAKQVAPYLVKLDKMNEMLGQSFGFKPGHNIWRGKAVVVAFLAKQAFLEFEQEFYKRTETGNAIGLCHSHGNGKVIVSCYRGNDPNFFAAVLVHETAHGYIHRYKSTVPIPTWINEGIADWIAMMVVPSSKEVRFRQTEAAARLRQTHTFGGQFFNNDRLDGWQYGSASAIIQLMLKASPEQFKLFFNGIKEGLTWQDSLQRAYGLTVEQLSQVYGQTIGIPRLTP
ncbi:hypothetical protein Enr10x_49660 [Gimesia panareensis]|uniref:DUF1570 domain-containing protein n=1 Tax=Gimesia panareensis TaxID=2527978 RepID=A0A517QDB1_9PLAN|nr:hypothetical protein [Gimesia panareensis]QDT29611.1 hypothetical protein Enr10x_49660 [Gimesia panareensis]